MTDHKYGPKGHIVDAFFDHLRGMSVDDWYKVIAARNAAGGDAWEAAWDAARNAAWEVAGVAAWYAARGAAWEASPGAAWEIQGADLMRERGQPFFFLPLFGFADDQAVLAALQPKEGVG